MLPLLLTYNIVISLGVAAKSHTPLSLVELFSTPHSEQTSSPLNGNLTCLFTLQKMTPDYPTEVVKLVLQESSKFLYTQMELLF